VLVNMRGCVVFGCSNSDYTLERWRQLECDIHTGSKKGRDTCNCPPPFTLYPFPTERKASGLRLQWIKLINRQDTSGKNWVPNYDSRVCSKHFVDGKPTAENPNPTLALGYDSTSSSSKPKRKPPAARSISTAACATAETVKTNSQHNYSPTFDQLNNSDHCYSILDSRLKAQLQQKHSHSMDLISDTTKFVKKEIARRLDDYKSRININICDCVKMARSMNACTHK
jgi:hypothetical protein